MQTQDHAQDAPAYEHAPAFKKVRRMERGMARVANAVTVVTTTIIGLMLLVAVTLRYLLGSSLPYATEVPTYLFPWLICGGIVTAAVTGGHLAVDVVVERLPRSARRALRTAMWTLIAVVLAIVTVLALSLRDTFAGQVTPILRWPSQLSYVAYPLALAALTAHAVGRSITSALGAPPPSDAFAEVSAITDDVDGREGVAA